MKRIMRNGVALLTILALAACAAAEQDDDHDHGSGDHAHAADLPTVATTMWQDGLELFLEHPAFVVNEHGSFAVHLTVLDGFQPVRSGSVSLRFRGPQGTVQEVEAGDLLEEGTFKPEVIFFEAGSYGFDLTYRGPDAEVSFTVPGFQVHASVEAVPARSGDSAAIDFHKEQQWKVPFATGEVIVREIKRSVWAIGEVMPAPGRYIEIEAPVAGIIQAGGAEGLALPGSRVRKGETVATIFPPLQGNTWAASRLAFEQAQRNLQRAHRLHEKQAISDRELEEARNEYLTRKAGYERLAAGDDGDGEILTLQAPLDGMIIEWQVSPGHRVEAGDELMAIADPSVVWLKVNVYERDFRDLGRPVGAFVRTGGDDGGWVIPEAGMRVLSTGGVLDPVTRTLPVLLEVDNPEGRLHINESTPVELYASEGSLATAVPRSAIYEDEGLDVVFVQTGGESFAMRAVEVGPGQGEWVSIRAGLQPGERIVVRGGYHVKLAATTTGIGDGHAH